MDYTMENTLNYVVAKHTVEKHGGKVSHLAGDLYIEYPDQPTRKVEQVYIQYAGWRYPTAELAPPGGWPPVGMMMVYQLDDGSADGLLYVATLDELMDAIKENVEANTNQLGQLEFEFDLAIHVVNMPRAEFEALPPRD